MDGVQVTTFDAPWKESKKQREAFNQTRNAERYYNVQLRKVAKQIGDLTKAFDPNDQAQLQTVRKILERYAEILRPWAQAVAGRMLAEVSRRDLTAWMKHSQAMGISLRNELMTAPIGHTVQQLMDDQVTLITSLPLDAAQRVHDIVVGNLYGGARAADVAKEIMNTGLVTQARADLIARTETGRAATSLTEARAVHIGSPGYIWRNSGDYKVRPELGIAHFAQLNTLKMGSHRKLEGTFHKWSEPPIAGTRGERAHPGCIYNCRCWAEPVYPDKYI